MSEKTTFIVIAYKVGARGKLVAEPPQTAKTRERAIVTGQRMSESRAGVAVIEETSDSAADIFGEPKLVWHAGRVPDEMLAMDAA